MKVPFSWLKELVDIDITAQELEDKLFSCGFEVEERTDLSAGIDKVVVGRHHLHRKAGGHPPEPLRGGLRRLRPRHPHHHRRAQHLCGGPCARRPGRLDPARRHPHQKADDAGL